MVKLHFHDDDCDKNTCEIHEDHIKIAVLMFYLFHKLEDIQLDGSYVKLFHRDLQLFKNLKVTTMWLKVFEILQHIVDHRHSMQHDTPKQTLLLKIPTTNLIQKGNQ